MPEHIPDIAVPFNRPVEKLIPVFTGKLLPIGFLTVIMVLYSRKLSYYDYGLFQTVWMYCNIISVVISFGFSSILLSSGFDHFIGFLKRNRIYISLSYCLGAIVVFAIYYFTDRHFTVFTKLLLILFIILQTVCTVTDTLLIKHNRLKIYLWINIFYASLFFTIHLYFYYHPFVLNHLLEAIIILSAFKGLAIVLGNKKTIVVPIVAITANIAASWFYVGVNEITGIIARWLDKLFLLYLLAPAEFAVFFNGAFEIPLFGILISAMENVMLTGMSADVKNKIGAMAIFKESFKVLSIIAFPLFFFLLTMHTEAFAIVFNNKYNASIPVFLISIFIIPVRINHYGVILQCYGQAGKIAFGSLLDIGISLLLMVSLYPFFGTPGVAFAIVLSTYLQAAFYLWQSAKLMEVSIFVLIPLGFLSKLLLVLAGFYGLLYFLKGYLSPLISLVAVSVITGIIITGNIFFYWKKNNRPEATTIRSI